MKAGDFIEALERFFLDIIGTVLPGLAMLVGFCYVTGKPFVNFSEVLFKRSSDYEWALLLGFSYILGHGVTSLGIKLTNWLEKTKGKNRVEKTPRDSEVNQAKSAQQRLFSFVVAEDEISERLFTDPIFKVFKESVSKKIPALAAEANPVTNVRTWRSLALSIAQDQSHLVYRFAFISLLNLGVATASICTWLLWATLLVLKASGASVSVVDFNLLFILFLAAPYFFLERYYSFNRRALQVPFSMAIAKLNFLSSENAEKGGPAISVSSLPLQLSGRRLKVYLAGGFQSGWQDGITKAAPAFDYLDPRSHGLKNKTDYTAWDLEAIRRSDCVFAYLESTNPGGYALALEIGFAKALGKFVILVDEKSAVDDQTARYLEMIAQASDVSFKSLQEGVGFLEKFKDFA